MAANKRGGIRSVTDLPKDVREPIEQITNLLNRVTGVGGKVKLAVKLDKTPLAGAATLADTIVRVNELHAAFNLVVDKVNEVIDRIQED